MNKFPYYVISILGFFIVLFCIVNLACAQPAADAAVAYREFPLIGSRTAVWIVAQLHLNFAAFILGVPIFSVLVEFVGICTKNQEYDKTAKEFIKLTLRP